LQNIEAYGLNLQAGMSRILDERNVVHSFTGHPALMGLFFAEEPPSDYRGWLQSDYAFYDTLAPELHDRGILIEPDSREPWFLCEAHVADCLDETLDKFEQAVDITLDKLGDQKESTTESHGKYLASNDV
jgi:glutamate-1-semialdehyde 2,1-aminomutase